MRSRVGGLAAATIASSVLVGSAQASAAGPTKPCADDRSARCGSILVPLYRAAPDGGGRRLRVHFRVFPRTDRSKPALEPVVAAEGGPGYPSIDSAESYLFMLGPLRRRHDLIVVDNRGTGRSGAIDCPRLQAAKGVYSREVGRCARRLGRRANAYGTGAAADDLAAVLDKLARAGREHLRRLVRDLLRPGLRREAPGARARRGARRGLRRRGLRPVDPPGVRGRAPSPGRRSAGAPWAATSTRSRR